MTLTGLSLSVERYHVEVLTTRSTVEQWIVESPFCLYPEHTGDVMHIPADGFVLFELFVAETCK